MSVLEKPRRINKLEPIPLTCYRIRGTKLAGDKEIHFFVSLKKCISLSPVSLAKKEIHCSFLLNKVFFFFLFDEF